MKALLAILRRVAGGNGRRGGQATPPSGEVLLVGNPNVGKSAVFNWLTRRYVTVSNYPGTTVAVTRAHSRRLADAMVTDTPGMYSLVPLTEEERVARSLLTDSPAKAVVHVIDAKNIRRMLALTLQMIEAGLPVVVALNMSDEARRAGVLIDTEALESRLGVPVVATSATSGEGMRQLAERIAAMPDERPARRIDYGPDMEQAITRVEALLDGQSMLSRRTRALLLLQGDAEHRRRLLDERGDDAGEKLAQTTWQLCMTLRQTPLHQVALATRAEADKALDGVAQFAGDGGRVALRERLSRLLMNPWTGLPILAAVLYLGLYKFVGGLGAGVLVNALDGLFERWVNPWVDGTAEAVIPWAAGRDLLAGDFGVVTLGLRYAVAIVLPIVGTFFLAFSILEDSGYLPRLAMMIDRIFKKIGLNGRAVIPMVLGLGCDTMATMVTRTLETRRERVIATMLLALAIPCSAQVGVILGLLAAHPAALVVWAGVIVTVFLSAGLLAGRFLPGPRPSFYMELPPLRLPRIGNVVVKTYSRMVWYFAEVVPLFVLASVAIWVGRLTGAFQAAIRLLEPAVRAIGLPDSAAVAFLFGFFRRDYGVAGLYDLNRGGMLTGNQLAVSAVTLTLFLPCVAQLLIMIKERGWKLTLWVTAGIGVLAWLVGFALNLVLVGLGVQL